MFITTITPGRLEIKTHPQTPVFFAHAQAISVPQQVHAMHGARQQDVDAVEDAEEAKIAVFVASNQRHNHHGAFLALGTVPSVGSVLPKEPWQASNGVTKPYSVYQ